ncbi:MAG TPA: hypothetical protein VG841_13190 [Caulobacterales bacterium]|nr:hypothetical protein [Caulobacterales bacterium]
MAHADAMPKRGFALVRALVLFAIAYVLVTVLAASISIFYGAANNLSGEPPPGQSILQAPAFVATVPYHVLVMLVIWPAFAWLYFAGRRGLEKRAEVRETAMLGVLWLIAAMVVDFVGFVVIDNPWKLTVHEFYIEYQPWISLIYIAIFVSPWIRWGLARRR